MSDSKPAPAGSLNATDAAPLLPKVGSPVPAADQGYVPIGAPAQKEGNTHMWVYIGLALVGALVIATLIYDIVIHGQVDGVNSHLYNGPAPYKFSVDHIPPHLFQRDRGTCWDFATIGLLEADYRSNGIEKGYLQPDQYTQFSAQAYGMSMMKVCEDTGETNCKEFSDNVSENSTEGGEVGWLYYLPQLFSQVLPVTVCPYIPDSGHDQEHTCPGMVDALKKNPVLFNISGMQAAYNIEDTRALLLKYGRALGWSSLTHQAVYHLPCEDDWANRPECAEGKRVRCPASKHYSVDWCAVITVAGYTSDGLFYTHGEFIVEGGHAMLAVGYNDAFRTQDGSKGGFILRNSWEDRVYAPPSPRGPRGSHSMAFYMHNISDWDERTVCPNAIDPRNWLSCVNVDMGPTLRRSHRLARRANTNAVGDDDLKLDLCLDDKASKETVELARQPLEFVCTDTTWGCHNETEMRYFLYSLTDGPDDTSVLSMVEYNSTSKAKRVLTFPPLPADYLAFIFTPVASQLTTLKNNDLLCGFYFFPYDVLSISLAKFPGSYFSLHMDIDWNDQSYAANSKSHSDLDYTLLTASTFEQPMLNFTGPYPFSYRVTA